MVRSFSYALYTVLDRVTARAAEHRALLLPHARAWEQATVTAFVASYAAAMDGTGLWESFAEAQEWLQLFILEKAFYELRYEMNNRPQSMAIPLQGLLQGLGREVVAPDPPGA